MNSQALTLQGYYYNGKQPVKYDASLKIYTGSKLALPAARDGKGANKNYTNDRICEET